MDPDTIVEVVSIIFDFIVEMLMPLLSLVEFIDEL